jgi:hypothetical protein
VVLVDAAKEEMLALSNELGAGSLLDDAFSASRGGGGGRVRDTI